MDRDDKPIGRILSRREVLALFGLTGVSLLAGCGSALTSATLPAGTLPAETRVPSAATSAISASRPTIAPTATAAAAPTTAAAPTAAQAVIKTMPTCVIRPEVTEGPYYVNENLNRSDVRSDPGTGVVKAGALLELSFVVSQAGAQGCTPLPGVKVEIWHCDAAGVYSDVSDPGFSTKGQQFLRGYQLTDANGMATFTTIYPGWYRGRAIHIHFKVHPTANTAFTSQVFFDDALSDQVLALAPYASKGIRDRRNSSDGIFRPQLLLQTNKTDKGYAAKFDIGVQSV